jgi:hypothetical protein
MSSCSYVTPATCARRCEGRADPARAFVEFLRAALSTLSVDGESGQQRQPVREGENWPHKHKKR